MRVHLLVCVLGLIGHMATAQSVDSKSLATTDSCLPGMIAASKQFALPRKLLQTIGIVESGWVDPASGRVTAWPWAIHVSGISHFFATKAAAIEAVQDLQKAGTRSVDVGCMQINLMYHPGAFASLDEAFDPSANTQYGARFLSALYREIGNWPQATAAYHSRTQDIGASYEMRVMTRWPEAGRFSDGTLQQRGRTVAQETDLSIYTPEFAAQVKRQRRDLARLATMSGLIARSEHQPANLAGPGSRR